MGSAMKLFKSLSRKDGDGKRARGESASSPETSDGQTKRAKRTADVASTSAGSGSGQSTPPGSKIKPMSDASASFITSSVRKTSTVRKTGAGIAEADRVPPMNLAKTFGAGDGRFIFGIGAGWNVQEMGHHGVSFSTRWRELRERLEALRCLWTDAKANFSGEFVQISDSWQYPKPTQSGGPPVVLGTMDTEFGRRQVAAHGDGWLPLTFDVEETKASIADIHRQMKDLGRDPDKLDVSLFFLSDEMQSTDAIKKARDSGSTRAIMRLPIGDDSVVLRALDEYARSI